MELVLRIVCALLVFHTTAAAISPEKAKEVDEAVEAYKLAFSGGDPLDLDLAHRQFAAAAKAGQFVWGKIKKMNAQNPNNEDYQALVEYNKRINDISTPAPYVPYSTFEKNLPTYTSSLSNISEKKY